MSYTLGFTDSLRPMSQQERAARQVNPCPVSEICDDAVDAERFERKAAELYNGAFNSDFVKRKIKQIEAEMDKIYDQFLENMRMGSRPKFPVVGGSRPLMKPFPDGSWVILDMDNRANDDLKQLSDEQKAPQYILSCVKSEKSGRWLLYFRDIPCPHGWLASRFKPYTGVLPS